ncbi:MAG: hypothetical protein ACI90V_006424 [Bacillariaceae sp.]|jgi:hypothetical protein
MRGLRIQAHVLIRELYIENARFKSSRALPRLTQPVLTLLDENSNRTKKKNEEK